MNRSHRNRWSASDHQAFADGNRLRAQSIPGRRRNGPALEEWRDLLDAQRDPNGNICREDGVDRCPCGCKYWAADHCVDCDGTDVIEDDAR